ncbi:hypothetical protein GIS00_12035 [Nakamurella sp. YIM 132087]|uniref:Uncharacterized protein n=1 Tax=Nakamurella alba TaxID=2665158 RepID=A0A7K1FKK5_9ACTN|nr:hypothetical protein [Nakamurella alba]MTD14672.1 hypothetical protein [Nakamurella alba]
MDRPNKLVPVTLSGCEGYFEYAAADLYVPAGTIDFLFWDGVRTEYADIYDWEIRPGVYSTADGNGYAHDRTLRWQYTNSTIKTPTPPSSSPDRPASPLLAPPVRAPTSPRPRSATTPAPAD